MKQSAPQRSVAMDVIRCLALFLVVSFHFFLYTGFFKTLVVGSRMYLLTVIRSASMMCVPLFLLLSGYLMKNKTPSRQYYGKLFRTVSLYFLASACCYLSVHRLSGSFLDYLLKTLGFQASSYAWYMEMYFGLFLLIPYLNILYKGLPDAKSRRGLILTFLALTSFIKVVNCFQYAPDMGWQFSPNPDQSLTLLPTWWEPLYPAAFYYLGSYLKDYPLKMSRKTNLLLLLLAVVGNATVNYCISYGREFMTGSWQDMNSILNAVQSVLLFNLLAGMEFRHLSGKPARLLSRMSELSLSAYLVSCIFDVAVYSLLNRIQPVTAYQIVWYPVATLVIFTASLCLSWILDLIYTITAGLIGRLFRRQPV